MILNEELKFYSEIKESDKLAIVEILTSSGFFYPYEITVAVELLEDKLNNPDSTYNFIFVEYKKETIAFTSYGLIPCTISSYDLYWMAVHQNFRNNGIGKFLMQQTESAIFKLGGTGIYIETSGREKYQSTRHFYTSCSYKKEAILTDFYEMGDDKVIFSKRV